MPEVIFNDEFWDSGMQYNCHSDGNILYAAPGAVYISKAIDSLEGSTVWNRLKFGFEVSKDDKIKFSYFACDYKTVYHNNELIDIDMLLDNESIELTEKTALLYGLWVGDAYNPENMPLCMLKGRYFWFRLDFETISNAIIRKLKINFKLTSLSVYLPEFYQLKENNFDFLNRFLSIFQSLYLDLDKEITNISRVLDIRHTDYDSLKWLASWVAIDETLLPREETLRNFVMNAYNLYKIKGTKECLQKVIELYTGKKPLIVETYETLAYSVTDLFGSDIYAFTIIVEQENLSGDKSVSELKRIIEYYKPLHTNFNIVILKPFLVVGQHTYLGINTRISENTELELDEKSMIPFGTMILQDKEYFDYEQ